MRALWLVNLASLISLYSVLTLKLCLNWNLPLLFEPSSLGLYCYGTLFFRLRFIARANSERKKLGPQVIEGNSNFVSKSYFIECLGRRQQRKPKSYTDNEINKNLLNPIKFEKTLKKSVHFFRRNLSEFWISITSNPEKTFSLKSYQTILNYIPLKLLIIIPCST